MEDDYICSKPPLFSAPGMDIICTVSNFLRILSLMGGIGIVRIYTSHSFEIFGQEDSIRGVCFQYHGVGLGIAPQGKVCRYDRLGSSA